MEPQHSACSSTRLLTQLPSVPRTEGNDWSQANFGGSVLCPSPHDPLARCPSPEGTDEEFKKKWLAGKVKESSGCHCLVPRVLQATHSHNHTYTHTFTHSHTHPPTHPLTLTHRHTFTHTLTHLHTCTLTHTPPTFTHTHTLTNIPCPTHSHTHLTHPHTFTHILTPHTHNSHIH